MKKVYITFSGAAFDDTTRRIVECAPRLGADEVRVYDDAWLRGTPFYHVNRWIFERKPQMGYGWCSWKPFIILETLKGLSYDDVVLYTDADAYPIADLTPLFDYAGSFQVPQGMMLFEEQGCQHKLFTRRSCWRTMGLETIFDENAIHAAGRFQLFRKGQYVAQQFLVEWLTYSLNPECQFHDPSEDMAEDPQFIRHSAEQSVLSLLALKYSIPLHRCPDQGGWPVAWEGKYKPEDTYPQVFQHDGRRGRYSEAGSRFRNV
jgi:hypothetical protein